MHKSAKLKAKHVPWNGNNLYYYSTLAPFYHIRSRERAKYATVLHSKIMYCTAKSGFTGVRAEGLEKPNFDVIFSSGIINLVFDGLTYNTCGHFAHCSQLAEYPRVLYVKPSNKMYVASNCNRILLNYSCVQKRGGR